MSYVIVDGPVDLVVYSKPTTECEQFVIGSSAQTLQEVQLFFFDSAIRLKVVEIIEAHRICGRSTCCTATTQADSDNAQSKCGDESPT